MRSRWVSLPSSAQKGMDGDEGFRQDGNDVKIPFSIHLKARPSLLLPSPSPSQATLAAAAGGWRET